MTDSDNSTSMPLVTRRKVFVTAAGAIMGAQAKALAPSGWEAEPLHDPAVAVWRTWQALYEQTERLLRKQQRLERKFVEAIGVHCVTLLQDGDEQAHWDAVDKEIGYSATLRAEREAADRAGELFQILSKTPASSLAGVAAKLHGVLREGGSSKDDPEFPWPQLRSALNDILRLAGVQPGNDFQINA
ncbi:hypothetical protein [Mesorhizobium retamae]|uniref:Uncharacterized protein n=1 Tax=Mesorhizobium retamae TaxID=2912854 RepID=A0ABS9QMG3_9HYPH|nr:hypothetical protein [Mesorhizobium sp. IRAMC:0171]MCG7508628.1 hypothetical protein [Mesorhizobium sp. IRAMC:0171]